MSSSWTTMGGDDLTDPRHSKHHVVAKTFFYFVGFGCFLHVLLVPPPKAPTAITQPQTSRETSTTFQYDPAASASAAARFCPEVKVKTKTSLYREKFEKIFPVEIPMETVDDWDSIPCTNIIPTCDLKNTTFGYPFLMISFGRSGTTSTWDIIAGLTGEYIPRATEDMGRSKEEARDFFEGQNQTEHGKCWLERLLCAKQEDVRKAYQDGMGRAGIYGSKWKPWHEGLNSTQARQALKWLGTQKQIKVLYNTRNMVDMYISQTKHIVLSELFGDERTAHCYDDRELELSDSAWSKLASMGIPRNTPCAQIFRAIESKTSLEVPHMIDYFQKNVLQTDFASEILDYYRVSKVTVTYEKLYFTKDAEEWERIFQYLGFGPQSNLTLDQVFARTAFQKTSFNDRSQRMANYDEVKRALQSLKQEHGWGSGSTGAGDWKVVYLASTTQSGSDDNHHNRTKRRKKGPLPSSRTFDEPESASPDQEPRQVPTE
eukprot:scaffold9946_cov188-Amphora_coffeaeformis.AAC.14